MDNLPIPSYTAFIRAARQSNRKYLILEGKTDITAVNYLLRHNSEIKNGKDIVSKSISTIKDLPNPSKGNGRSILNNEIMFREKNLAGATDIDKEIYLNDNHQLFISSFEDKSIYITNGNAIENHIIKDARSLKNNLVSSYLDDDDKFKKWDDSIDICIKCYSLISIGIAINSEIENQDFLKTINIAIESFKKKSNSKDVSQWLELSKSILSDSGVSSEVIQKSADFSNDHDHWKFVYSKRVIDCIQTALKHCGCNMKGDRLQKEATVLLGKNCMASHLVKAINYLAHQ